MTTSQFFVYRRPIAWTALVATLIWGVFAYMRMPRRQDPELPVRVAVVLTPFPGARAEKVEQEVTRKVERKVAENPRVETVHSLSRTGLSVVFVELFDATRDVETVWQDLRGKLREIGDLPTMAGSPLVPYLNKDFGDTVAVMLTLSSPPVSEFEVERRVEGIRRVLVDARASRPEGFREDRVSGILIHPDSVDRNFVRRTGESLLARLDRDGLIADGLYIEAPGAGCIDFAVEPGVTDAQVVAAAEDWRRDAAGAGLDHPDLWSGVLVRDLDRIGEALRAHEGDPLRPLDRYSYRDLRRFADLIQDRLKASPRVGKVEQIGLQREAVELLYSDRRLASFGVKPADVAQRLRQRNTNLPGGSVELTDQQINVRPSGEFRSPDEIGQVIVARRDGFPLYLRDLVDVVRGYEDPPGVMNFRTVRAADGSFSTHRALTLAIHQVSGAQVAAFSRDLDDALESLRGVLPGDLRIERTSDQPEQVREKVRQFNQNFLEAVAIVILVALLFMEWRSALLVAASIPLTVAMTLGFCDLLGVDLQQVSIAALIIALGLLVDDPVVASDAINREMAEGHPRDVAAWLGPQKLARAILFATLTNCVAFLPLLLIEGQTGEFVWTLPVVVTASLVASRIVSMTFMPLLGYYLLKGQHGFEAGLRHGGKGATFARYYNGFSEWFLRRRWLTLGFSVLLLAGGVALLPLIGTSFFPKDRHTVFSVNLFLSEGTPIRLTRDEALRTLERIESLAGGQADAFTTFIGSGGPRFWFSVVPEQRADNYAQILVHTSDPDRTADLVKRLKRELPPLVASARVTIEQLETGPPVGVPVQIRLYGPDLETLRALSGRTRAILRSIPGTDSIHDDWDPETMQVALDISPDRAGMIGLSNEDLAAMVQAGLSGYAPTMLAEGDQKIPIRLRLRPEERAGPDALGSLALVSTSAGLRVPLSQVVEVRPEMVAPKIRRRNHERCLTVKSDAVPGVLPSAIVGAADRALRRESASWPPGYRYEFGGEREEQAKGFRSVAIALAVSLASIYLALVLQFNSVTKPLVVFAAVPFGIVAGMLGLLIFDAPFGFMAFLGVASLAGVIVSHIIVLFDYIEEMHHRGEDLHRAVIDAALVRLRPVLVTVLATVGGLVPLAIEGGPLWEPMCYVQIVGLLAATLVTKIVVPVLYVIFVEDLRWIEWTRPADAAPLAPPADGAMLEAASK